MTIVAAIAIGLGTALALLGMATPMRHMAASAGLVDRGERDGRLVVRGFGIAMLPVALIGLIIAELVDSAATSIATAAAALGFGVIGAIDDLRPRSSVGRLIAQVVIAAGFAAAVTPDLIRGPVIPSAILCVIGLVGFVNVYNFMDGIDGISVVSALVGGSWLVYCGLEWDSPEAVALGAIVVGCALGFAPFNIPVARAFLGDSGSYLLGALLAIGVVRAIDAGAPVLATVMMFSLYVFDVGATLLVRLSRGDRLLGRHREFAFHRLAAGNLGHMGTTALVGAIMLVLCLLGLATVGQPLGTNAVVLVAVAVLLLGYLALPARLHLERKTSLEESHVRDRRTHK